MEYNFNKIDRETLVTLYSEYGLRMKEIGALVGVSEDAILKRIKIYGIPTNLRDKVRQDVVVTFSGKRKDKKKELTGEVLRSMCNSGMSDEEIGKLFNLSGHGVSFRRDLLGITVSDKYNSTREALKKFEATDRATIVQDYYGMNQYDFSEKYGISKTLWRPLLKKMGITDKSLQRVLNYPPLTEEQRTMIIGSLLGDGSVSGETYFYESHSLKQKRYLESKVKLLGPYISRVVPCDGGAGLRLSTVHHPVFKEFYQVFYKDGVKGKAIPLEYLNNNWNDDIISYWYFDDGYLDDETGEITIANKCPNIEEHEKMIVFLQGKYGWNFHGSYGKGVYGLTFSKRFYGDFVKIIMRRITPDLYYKLPEEFLTSTLVSSVAINSIKDLKPKFYRKAPDIEKAPMEEILFKELKNRPFPYTSYTGDRLSFLLNSFKKFTGYTLRDGILKCSTSGLGLCEYFFPNIYEAHRKGHKSPADLWGDENFLRALAINRLKYANRLTDSALRTGIKLLGRAVFNFKPVVAKYVYDKYATELHRVYDYSCGFGSRMLSAMSIGLDYVGCEPNLKTNSNLCTFGDFLKVKNGGTYTVVERGSEEYIPVGSFDIAFSSPPFFDYEVYSEDPGQSIVKFPEYETWLECFWKKVILNCLGVIKPKGYFGVCITMANHADFIEETRNYCLSLGLFLVEQTRVSFQSVFNKSENYDLLMVFRKAPV